MLITLKHGAESFTFSNKAGLLYIKGLGNINTSRFEPGKTYEIGTREFKSNRATIADVASSIERMPQIILPKDTYFINYLLDSSSEDTILEIGAGNGSFSILTALGFHKHLVSYEINRDVFNILLKNIRRFECDGLIEPVNDDGKNARVEEFSKVFIDNPEPEQFYKEGFNGIMVAYVPTYIQADKFSRFMSEKGFQVEIHEIVDIPIKMSALGLRPESSFIYHTAFIVAARSEKYG